MTWESLILTLYGGGGGFEEGFVGKWGGIAGFRFVGRCLHSGGQVFVGNWRQHRCAVLAGAGVERIRWLIRGFEEGFVGGCGWILLFRFVGRCLYSGRPVFVGNWR